MRPPLVDAHVHLWDPAVPGHDWLRDAPPRLRSAFTVDDLLEAGRDTAVDGRVLVESAASLEATRLLLDQAAGIDAVVVGWVDAGADVQRQLQELAEHPFGHLLVGVRVAAGRLRALGHLAEVLQARGLVFEALVEVDGLPGVAALASAHPGLTIVVDHLGGVVRTRDHPGWSHAMADLATHPNVFVKVSGLHTGTQDRTNGPPAWVAEARGRFGSERLMLGSDWPVSTQRMSYGETMRTTLRLIEQAGCDVDAVACATARRIYWGSMPRG